MSTNPSVNGDKQKCVVKYSRQPRTSADPDTCKQTVTQMKSLPQCTADIC